MLLAVYRQSLKEFTRFMRYSPWILLAFLSALLAIFWKHVSPDTSQSNQYTGILVFYTFRIGALTGAVLATSILNAEVEQKTIVYLLTKPVPRWQLLLGRYLACSTAVSIVSIVAVLSAAFGVYGLSFLSHSLLLHDLFAVVLGSFAYCAFFTLMSVLTNRSLIINLLIAFGWEVMVPSLPGTAYMYSILTYMMGIHLGKSSATIDLSLFSNVGTNHNFSLAMCIFVLSTIAVVCIVVGAVVFGVTEFIPKEQAA